LHFEGSALKAAQNLRKHRVAFEEAVTLFSDEHARLIADPDHSATEDRFVLLGLSGRLRLLVVVHCYPGGRRRDPADFRAQSDTR
jgi:uncharacterized DUF497 family protein